MTGLKIKFLKLQKRYLQFQYISKKFDLFSKEKLKLATVIALLAVSISGFYGLGHLAYAQDEGGCTRKMNCNDGTASQQYVDNVTINGIMTGAVKTVMPVPAEYGENGQAIRYTPAQDTAMSTLMATTGKMFVDTPASTHQYMAYILDKADIGPSATYAQENQGYDILNPIISLWEWSRNVVFLFYVVIFVVIGAMIILRQRIGGQIPITIINSIPNVIISLILVTFSYPIAGLIMDLMNLATGVIYAGLFGAGGPGGDLIDKATYTFQSPEMSVFQIFGTANVTNFEAGFNLPDIDVGETGANWLLNVLTDVIEGLSSWNILVSTVLVIAAVAAMFKVFFTLLTEYLTFMIYPIIAPFQFLIGSLPGRSNVIWEWFKTMIGAAGSFIGVYLAFCIMIIISVSGSAIGDFTWYPPLTAFTTDSSTIRHLLAYAIFISAPQIPGMVKQLIQAPAGIGAGAAVGGETRKAISKVPIVGGLLG